MSYFEEMEPVRHPCPICGEDMHPAMERRYGHCGGPYCSGWDDAQADLPSPHAAAFGCTGVGEPHRDVDTNVELVDGSWWVTYWHRGEKLLLSGEGDFVVARCTATDALASTAEVRGGR